MNTLNVRRTNAVCYLSIATLGMYLSAYQFALNDITREFALTAWVSGLLIAMHFIASFFMPPIAGELSDRMGRRPVLLGCFALMILGILCAALSQNIVLLAVGAFITGGGACTVESGMSGLLAEVNPQEENRVMNLSQMFFCGGAVISPLYGAWLSGFGLDWRFMYYTVIGLVILSAAFLFRTDLPKAPPAQKGLYLGIVLKRPYYLLMFAAMLLYVGIEESAAFWAGSYAEIAGGGVFGPLALESWLLAGYWLGMGSARLLAANIRHHMGKITIVGLILAAASFGAMLFLHTAWAFILFYALAGFTLAPTWPMVMVGGAKAGADVPSTAAGGITAAGSIGGTVIPFLLGIVQDAAGNRASVLLLAGIIVLETILLASSKQFRNS